MTSPGGNHLPERYLMKSSTSTTKLHDNAVHCKCSQSSAPTTIVSAWFSEDGKGGRLQFDWSNDWHHSLSLDSGLSPNEVASRLNGLAETIRHDFRQDTE